MPITAIIKQPISKSINAAYRPVVIRLTATNTDTTAKPPVVYCDIYFNDIFYKTIPKSQYAKLNSGDSEWQFDIQDAAQEYLQKFMANNGESLIKEATLVVTKASCKFRSSGYDSNGFITPEGVEPVQGVGDTAAIAGSGTASNDFYIVNATLQHQDNQELTSHLSSFKNRTWEDKAWPLTHRPDHYKICLDDSDYFPIIYNGCSTLTKLRLNYKWIGQNTFHQISNSNLSACPLLVNLEYEVIDNGDGTQTFTFTFDGVDPAITSLNIQYRKTGSGNDWTDDSDDATSPRTITVPLGKYDFRFITKGTCVAQGQTPDDLQNIGVTGDACDVCAAVAIVTDFGSSSGIPDLPNAEEETPYNYSFNLTGDGPFVLSGITKPAWMNILITGNTVNLTGTPDIGDADDDLEVSFTITNCDGANSDNFTGSIDVTASSTCEAVAFDGGAPALPDATTETPYIVDIDLTGDGPFALSGVTKPAWMIISIVGSQVQLRGTPAPTDVAADVEVIFTVSNCGGVHTVVLNDTIDVVAVEVSCRSYELDPEISVSAEWQDCTTGETMSDTFFDVATVCARTGTLVITGGSALITDEGACVG
jgi:hypothetical protein